MLAHEIPLSLSVDPGLMDRTLALMYPTTCDTAYFGGITISMCT